MPAAQEARDLPEAPRAAESSQLDEIPVIDLDIYLSKDPEGNPTEAAILECKKVALSFHQFGVILIRDPRVNMQDNEEYVDLMEEYFADVGQRFYDK